MSEELTVCFRKEGNDILAVFPYEVGTSHPETMTCYAHVGQHSSASQAYVLYCTKPAKPEEYESLKAELDTRYAPDYHLRVLQRYPVGAYEKRKKALAEMEISE